MSIVRYEPFRSLTESYFPEFESLTRRMNRLLTGTGVTPWEPPVDIVERDKEVLLRAELPGVDPKDVKIEVKGGVLTLSGERKWEEEQKGETYYRVERSYGKFSRSFSLTDGMDGDKVTARCDKGILEVHIPKAEKALPRTVEVKVN